MIRRPHRRPVRSAFLVLVVAMLAAAGTLAAFRYGNDPDGQPSPRRTLARVMPPMAPTPSPRSAAERRSEELAALLASRAAAILHRDRARFLATVDTASPGFRRSQARLFAALSHLRFASWRYDLDAPAIGRPVPSGSRRAGGETYAPRSVLVLYQLAGFDAAPTSTRAGLTFIRRGSRWLLAADSDFDRSSGRTQRELWDFGPLTTVSGAHTLVIGRPAARSLLLRLRDEAERDIPRVNAVWGRRWTQRVAILVPADQAQLATLLNRPTGSLGRIAAVATAELGGTGPTAAVGNRILVNPANIGALGALGRRIVITHEITHVATRAETGAAAPTWLVEGFADYVAYRSASVPISAAAPDLRADVRAGRLPDALPADGDFTGTNPALASAYEQSWLAVRLIAERAGQPGLLRFYRAVAGASAGSRSPAYAAALARELHASPAGFTALWRGYLRAAL